MAGKGHGHALIARPAAFGSDPRLFSAGSHTHSVARPAEFSLHCLGIAFRAGQVDDFFGIHKQFFKWRPTFDALKFKYWHCYTLLKWTIMAIIVTRAIKVKPYGNFGGILVDVKLV